MLFSNPSSESATSEPKNKSENTSESEITSFSAPGSETSTPDHYLRKRTKSFSSFFDQKNIVSQNVSSCRSIPDAPSLLPLLGENVISELVKFPATTLTTSKTLLQKEKIPSYNVKFKFHDTLFNRKDKAELKTLRAQITISVGCSEKHSGEYFRDTLNEAAETFGSVVIMLDDSVQWRTLAIGIEDPEQRTQDKLRTKADENAQLWLNKNQSYIMECQNKYQDTPDKIILIRWKDFDSINVQKAVNAMHMLYANNEYFRIAIRKTALDFLLRVKGYDFRLQEPTRPDSDADGSLELEPGVFYLYKKDDMVKYSVKSPDYVDILDATLKDTALSDHISELISRNEAVPKKLKPQILDITSSSNHTRKKLGRQDANGNSMPPYCTNEEIMGMSEGYLLEECGVMAKIWTSHPKLKADVELYPAERTEAMKATHEYLIRKKYNFRLNEDLKPPKKKEDIFDIELSTKKDKLYYITKLTSDKEIEITRQDCVDYAKIKKNDIPPFLSRLYSSVVNKELLKISSDDRNLLLKIIAHKKHLLPSLLEATEITFQALEKKLVSAVEQVTLAPHSNEPAKLTIDSNQNFVKESSSNLTHR